MRTLGQDVPVLDFVITAPAPSPWELYRRGERASWAGPGADPIQVPIPPAPGWWDIFLADPFGHIAAATGTVLRGAGTVVQETGRTVGATVGTAAGAAGAAAGQQLFPDLGDTGRVLILAGVGLVALYLLAPAGRRRR